LAKFDLKANNADITLDTVVVTTTGSGYLVALRLYDGTDLLAEATPAATTTFSDLLISIAKDTTKTLTVKGLAEVSTSTHVGDVAVTLYSYSGTDVNDNVVQASGLGIAGNTIHLYTIAPVITQATGTPGNAFDSNATGGADAVEFTIQFTVTAEGGDIWIASTTIASDTAQENNVTVYCDRAGTPVAPTAYLMTSSATVDGWGYKIPKGQSATFTVKITIADTGTAGYYRGKVVGFDWATTNTGTRPTAWSAPWAVGNLVTTYAYLTAH
jgi:hypothetical protein